MADRIEPSWSKFEIVFGASRRRGGWTNLQGGIAVMVPLTPFRLYRELRLLRVLAHELGHHVFFPRVHPLIRHDGGRPKLSPFGAAVSDSLWARQAGAVLAGPAAVHVVDAGHRPASMMTQVGDFLQWSAERYMRECLLAIEWLCKSRHLERGDPEHTAQLIFLVGCPPLPERLVSARLATAREASLARARLNELVLNECWIQQRVAGGLKEVPGGDE